MPSESQRKSKKLKNIRKAPTIITQNIERKDFSKNGLYRSVDVEKMVQTQKAGFFKN